MRWLLLTTCLLAGCKKSEPTPVALTPPPTSDNDVRRNGSLKVTDKAGAFEISDGGGHVTITLPSKPTVTGEMASQGGVEVFNGQAVMPGDPVDVQFGVATVKDGAMPPEMAGSLASLPQTLADAASGKVAKNETGTLAGRSARVFEITTGDHRRLFGWYLIVAEQARMYQLNCVGADGAPSRTACTTIASSLSIK
jgi:hypothetical protein